MKTATRNNLQNYQSSIVADVSAEEAFKKIGRICEWWATNVDGDPLRLNAFFTVRFGKTFAFFKTTEIISNKKIVWHVVDCYLPLFKNVDQWNNTKLVWDISTQNNKTQISMTHVGLTPEIECFSDCEKGWNFYVKESLAKLITENKGLPGYGIFCYILNADRKYEGILFTKNDPLPDFPIDSVLIDVKETNGEQVIAAYSATELNRKNFDVQLIKGEYYMLVENKHVVKNISPLEDILEALKLNF